MQRFFSSCLVTALGLSWTFAAEIHVAPGGLDSNPGTAAAPLRTLGAARDVARAFAGKEKVEIRLHPGTFYLGETLTLGPGDSGSELYPVWYRAEKEGQSIVSGGLKLNLDWETVSNRVYRARTPADLVIDQLFVNGVRQQMARYPDFDPARPTAAYQGYAADAFSKERAARWADPVGGYIHAMHSARWGGYHYLITGRKPDGSVLYEGGWQNNRQMGMHRDFRMVENIFEELDAPGEWYHDRRQGWLYCIPQPGLDLPSAAVEVVRLSELIDIQGSREKPVRHVRFQGLVFRHAARTFMETREPLLRSDWTIYRGGAVRLTGSEDVALLDCEFDQVGGNAVFVNNYNRRVTIQGCHIHDCGASGVCFVGSPKAVRDPLFEYRQSRDLARIDRTPGPLSEDYPSECAVVDSLIHGIGRVERQPAGVQISMARRIVVRNVTVYDCARAGINISDGTWGGHLFEGVDVFDTVLETDDHGSFNSWGRDRFWASNHRQVSEPEVKKDPKLPFLDAVEATVIRHSRWRCDHGWAIDLDDGSSHYEIHNNLLLAGGLKFREGYRRRAWNNVIVNNGFHPHVWFADSGDEFQRNIVMRSHADIGMPPQWGRGVDYNLFTFPADREAKKPAGCDAHSLAGNPRFINPDAGDFRVMDGSPALSLGFTNFPMDQFGVRKPSLRARARQPVIPPLKLPNQANTEPIPPTPVLWLGATVRDLVGEEFSALGVARDLGGVRVIKVPSGCQAEAFGFRESDLIQGIDDKPISSIASLRKVLATAGTGPVKVSIVRHQQPGRLEIAPGTNLGIQSSFPQVSGLYPHLAMFNEEGECGTGAVVPWAGRLWVITYAPHKPQGSSDKLYEITPDLLQVTRPESVGGTPANRMIHRESRQLFIGPYAIGADRSVRVIPYTQLFGRPTGVARHLEQPAEKIVVATMEEGVYQVDVGSLEVMELWADEQKTEGRKANLPGYHGKGFYSGQGRYVYANNGDHARAALTNPAVPSGVLAQWDGKSSNWTVVRRNQFTEVTGPGGIDGNASTSDPVWTVGWDHRSLILMVLHGGNWHSYRLPKASHCYDGAHGWNTEWPRIRDIGQAELLMTMHGSFWRFPRRFSPGASAGILPRSTYLKVIGDFCLWRDQVVFGCDDNAQSEFLNKSDLKGDLAGPGKSQSNLWFVDPAALDHFGPALGRGSVWVREDVAQGAQSEPFLFSGFVHRSLFLAHQSPHSVAFDLEVDRKGDGNWQSLRRVEVPGRGCVWMEFGEADAGVWIRIRAAREASSVTAAFHYRGADERTSQAGAQWNGIATPADRNMSGGLLHARGADHKTLRFLARGPSSEPGCYDLDAGLELRKVEDPQGQAWMAQRVAIPPSRLTFDPASVLYVDAEGRRWRLPKGDPAFEHAGAVGPERLCREVATERNLLNAHGTFYELPAENAGGFRKLRPVATHNRRITDYAGYRGMLVISGVAQGASGPHIVRSGDGQCALWVGAIDDLWQLGKPRGTGGPWAETKVTAGQPSDPYLMAGYDRKRLDVSHGGPEAVRFDVEVDVTGDGDWCFYQSLSVDPGQTLSHRFPPSFGAYWVRLTAAKDSVATARFIYD